MVRKRILVLAFSLKNGQRCVAGREIRCRAGQFFLGPWVRPVSDHGGGELNSRETTLANCRQIRVGDVVEMVLAGPANDPFQPENWRIVPGELWRDVGCQCRKPPLTLLEEQPCDLWLEPNNRSDRIAHFRLAAAPPGRSLYVIRPEDFRIRLYTDSLERQKRRAVFTYRGIEYDMTLTDPVISEKYCRYIPSSAARPQEVRLPGGDSLLCVSLAPNYQGQHYKVAATVFEAEL